MSPSEPDVHADAGWLHLKSVVSLLATILLCLPSLLGGAALLTQLALYKDINQWRETPSALIALGGFVGAPLVSMAAAVGGIIAFSRLSSRVKYAHLCIVGVSALATFALIIKFQK